MDACVNVFVCLNNKTPRILSSLLLNYRHMLCIKRAFSAGLLRCNDIKMQMTQAHISRCKHVSNLMYL